MGKRGVRWQWWFGSVLSLASVAACGKNERSDQPSADAGAAGHSTDEPASGGGAGESTHDAGGAPDGAPGGGGAAPVEETGGGGALIEEPSDGGAAPVLIANDVEVVATDCSGSSVAVEPALARFCLLEALCREEAMAECVWFRHRFDAAGPCAAEVTSCAELVACAGVSWEPGPDSCDLETSQVCQTPGLQCSEVTDPYKFSNPTEPLCVPAGCDYDAGEKAFPRCAGDDLIEETYVYYMRYVSQGLPDAEIHANVRVHCPDFGFATCLDGRCVH